jgi:hypothetical protein
MRVCGICGKSQRDSWKATMKSYIQIIKDLELSTRSITLKSYHFLQSLKYVWNGESKICSQSLNAITNNTAMFGARFWCFRWADASGISRIYTYCDNKWYKHVRGLYENVNGLKVNVYEVNSLSKTAFKISFTINIAIMIIALLLQPN